MARWGEEEKKGKGIPGCLLSFGVLILFSYTFYVNYGNLEGRRLLEKSMQSIVRNGYSKSEAQMISEILTAAEELELNVTDEHLELTKGMDDFNNPLVDVKIEFSFEVDCLLFQFPVSLPISESLVIVVF